MQMVQGNPAIARYAAEMDRAGAARRSDNEEFRQRFHDEQAIGADKALRGAIGNYYAAQPAAGQPAPAAAPAAAVAPAPQPAPTPALAAPPPKDYSIFTGAQPQPQAAAAPAPVAAPAPAAPVAALPRPTAPAAGGQRPLGPIISELAKTAGTGQHVMSLFTADQHQQQQEATRKEAHAERGSRLMLDALGKNDVAGAKLMAQQHGIEVPQEFWNNRQALANVGAGANMAKTMGVKGQHAVAFANAFAAHLAQNPNDASGAMAAAQKAVPAIGSFGGVKGRTINKAGEIVLYDAQGLDPSGRQVSGMQARPQRSGNGSAGRPSNTVQNRANMEEYIRKAYPGIDPQTVAKIIVNPRAQITPQDVMRMYSNAAKLKDAMGQPLYPNQAAVESSVKEAVAGAQRMVQQSMRADGANPANPGGAQPSFDSFFRSNETPPQDDGTDDGEDN